MMQLMDFFKGKQKAGLSVCKLELKEQQAEYGFERIVGQ